MPSTLQALGIDRLPISQRIALLQEIWESIAAELPSVELSETQKQELRRCAAEHEANPADVIPWEQVKAEALARFGRWIFSEKKPRQGRSVP